MQQVATSIAISHPPTPDCVASREGGREGGGARDGAGEGMCGC